MISGDASETAARALAAELNTGRPGEARAGLHVFKGRPHDNLVESYGPEFTQSLVDSAAGEWRALAHREGWRVVRLEAVTPPRPANFEPLRGVVLQDWTDEVMAAQRGDAVQAMASKYTVRVEAARP